MRGLEWGWALEQEGSGGQKWDSSFLYLALRNCNKRHLTQNLQWKVTLSFWNDTSIAQATQIVGLNLQGFILRHCSLHLSQEIQKYGSRTMFWVPWEDPFFPLPPKVRKLANLVLSGMFRVPLYLPHRADQGGSIYKPVPLFTLALTYLNLEISLTLLQHEYCLFSTAFWRKD